MLYGQWFSATAILTQVNQGTIITAFAISGKKTAGNLPFAAMINHALAATAPLIARSVGAGTMIETLFADTTHNELLRDDSHAKTL